MPLLHLTPDELVDITGRQRRSAQVRVLNEMRIPFRMNPDGKVLVVREQYLTAAGGKPTDQRQTEPDFEAIA